MTRNTRLLITLIALLPVFALAETPNVIPLRCPNDGIQPQAAVDPSGNVHLIYLKGDPAKSDIFYVNSAEGGKIWSKPIRVNSQPAAAIAVGTVRGAHLAIGKNNRIHVAWMGSSVADPKAPNDATPMLYARMNDAHSAFETQRNLITAATGLDGGGSLAADSAGNVYVAWHAPTPGMKGEENRTVWLSKSSDDGKTFAAETKMSGDSTGACGCCGMRLGIDGKGNLMALYRAANSQTRDIYLLEPAGQAKYAASKVETLAIKTCPMSTAAFARRGNQMLAAWETGGQVSFAAVDEKTGRLGDLIAAPGKSTARKHPTLAINNDGFVLFAWTEGTGWQKGGNLAWQVYDRSLKPVAGAAGTQAGVVTWSLGSAFARDDGSFVIVY